MLTLSHKEAAALRIIRNSIMSKGRPPSTRELMSALSYKSPRSAALLIDQLIAKDYLNRRENGQIQILRDDQGDNARAQTVDVPLVGIVACGAPLLSEENIEAMIPVSVKLAKPPHKYFWLKAFGDSMNQKGIQDGDLVLVLQQNTAQNGNVVVAMIDDETTIKEFHKSNNAIILKPRSSNKDHKPIVVTRDFHIQGVVITSVPNWFDTAN